LKKNLEISLIVNYSTTSKLQLWFQTNEINDDIWDAWWRSSLRFRNNLNYGIIYRLNRKLFSIKNDYNLSWTIPIGQIYLTNVKYQKTYGEEDKLFQCFNRNDTRGVNSRYGNLSLKFARVYYKVCRCNKFARRILRLKAFIIRYRKWKCFPFFPDAIFFLMAKHQRFKSLLFKCMYKRTIVT